MFNFGISFLVYTFFGSYPIVFIIAFLGASFFAFLISKHNSLKRRRSIVAEKIKINTTEKLYNKYTPWNGCLDTVYTYITTPNFEDAL